jgi:hypothetical protein
MAVTEKIAELLVEIKELGVEEAEQNIGNVQEGYQKAGDQTTAAAGQAEVANNKWFAGLTKMRLGLAGLAVGLAGLAGPVTKGLLSDLTGAFGTLGDEIIENTGAWGVLEETIEDVFDLADAVDAQGTTGALMAPFVAAHLGVNSTMEQMVKDLDGFLEEIKEDMGEENFWFPLVNTAEKQTTMLLNVWDKNFITPFDAALALFIENAKERIADINRIIGLETTTGPRHPHLRGGPLGRQPLVNIQLPDRRNTLNPRSRNWTEYQRQLR